MRQGVVLRGRPYQSPSTLEVIASIPHPSRISMADLNSDGHSGFLVGTLGRLLPGDHLDGAVVWMRPMPGGKYVQQVLEGWPRVADVRAADFDGDGKPDLAVAAFGWRTVGRLSVLENTSVVGARHRSLSWRIHVIPVDLNRDGKLDLVALFAQQFETVMWVHELGTADFSFHPAVLYQAPHPNWGSTGHPGRRFLDNDGDSDILLTHGDSFDEAIVKPIMGFSGWRTGQAAERRCIISPRCRGFTARSPPISTATAIWTS